MTVNNIAPCCHCNFLRCKRSQTNMNALRMRMKMTDKQCADFVVKRGAGYGALTRRHMTERFLLKKEED